MGYDENACWTGLEPGPAIADLAPRLSSIPQVFFDDSVGLRALAGDVLGAPNDRAMAGMLEYCDAHPRARRGAATALWLFASETVVEPLVPPLRRTEAARAIAFLGLRLATVVDATDWLFAAERREEAARAFLLGCGQLPAGEDLETARSLWNRHDSVRRNRALSRALTDHQHRLDVLAKLQTTRAAEAAARYSHE